VIYQGIIEGLILDDLLGHRHRNYASLDEFPIGTWTVKLYDSQYEEAMTRIKDCQQIDIVNEYPFYGGANVVMRFRTRPRIVFSETQE
jgi:hypothetical protein